jgi:hypothetical protein
MLLGDQSCPHWRSDSGGSCQIVTDIVAAPTRLLDNKACKVCTKEPNPRSINHVTVSLSLTNANLSQKSDREKTIYKAYGHHLKRYDVIKILGEGCGTVLHQILLEKGWRIEKDCPCLGMIYHMNKNGPVWCRKHVDDIIVPSMVREAQRRNISFIGIPIPGFALELKAREWTLEAIQKFESQQKTPPS